MNDFPKFGGEPQIRFPSNNKWGIPLLDVDRQADTFDLPIEPWGARRRAKQSAGTFHFYVDDYRFAALWNHPDRLLSTAALTVVEPNFAVLADTPPAIAIHHIYKKRMLARYWQSKGVRVAVDLNVGLGWELYNLLGVPEGWNAYATRGYSGQLRDLDRELLVARQRSGHLAPLLMVYGGSDPVREWCEQHGALWVPENSDLARNRLPSPNGEIP